jgi:hypothetical protein
MDVWAPYGKVGIQKYAITELVKKNFFFVFGGTEIFGTSPLRAFFPPMITLLTVYCIHTTEFNKSAEFTSSGMRFQHI